MLKRLRPYMPMAGWLVQDAHCSWWNNQPLTFFLKLSNYDLVHTYLRLGNFQTQTMWLDQHQALGCTSALYGAWSHTKATNARRTRAYLSWNNDTYIDNYAGIDFPTDYKAVATCAEASRTCIYIYVIDSESHIMLGKQGRLVNRTHEFIYILTTTSSSRS